ncbi:MAG: hypothetical protein H6765_05350 [Candidatus Peribacteria bacterium]|nr:MAG: hypothetical protein H6765_05350 [Candidatus Peribacteria bacterium]
MPPRRIIINLAPSHVKKVGTRFDLPIAVAVLKQLPNTQKSDLDDAYFFGEL